MPAPPGQSAVDFVGQGLSGGTAEFELAGVDACVPAPHTRWPATASAAARSSTDRSVNVVPSMREILFAHGSAANSIGASGAAARSDTAWLSAIGVAALGESTSTITSDDEPVHGSIGPAGGTTRPTRPYATTWPSTVGPTL